MDSIKDECHDRPTDLSPAGVNNSSSSSMDTSKVSNIRQKSGYWLEKKMNSGLRSLTEKGGMIRNLTAMILWQGANYLAPLLTFPHLARTLHSFGFGQYGIYLVIAGWMTIISDWGTNYTGSRLIAQTKASGHALDEGFWSLFYLRMMNSFIILIFVVAYILIFVSSLDEALLILAAWSIILGNSLTVSWCLQGLERLDAFAAAALVGRLFTVPATILLVRNMGDVWVAVAVQGGGGVVIGITSLYILYRSGAVGRMNWSFPNIVQRIKEGAPVVVSTASHGLYSTTATSFLGLLKGPYLTGQFVAADRIRLAAQGTVQPFAQVFYPRTSRLVVTDRVKAVRTIIVMLYVTVAVMVCGSILLSILAGFLTKTLVGPGFDGTIAILRILALCVGVYGMNVVLGWQTLMPFGYNKEFARVSFHAACINILLMPILVYKWGGVGAAIAVLSTESFILISYVLIIKQKDILASPGT